MKKFAVLVLMASAGVAMADKAPTSGSVLQAAGITGGAVDGFADRAITVVNLNNVRSFDGAGDANNVIINQLIAANAQIVGIGWDVTLFADSPSWLSEMVVGFGPTSGTLINLTPAIGDDFPGTQNYSSGGIVDLVALNLNFSLLADGNLRMEFFEAFNDFTNDWDGIWNGTLTIQWIPTPGALAILGLGGIAAGRRRR
jgi:hypothetical protein